MPAIKPKKMLQSGYTSSSRLDPRKRKRGSGWNLDWAQCLNRRLTGCCSLETEPERHWRWCCEHQNLQRKKGNITRIVRYAVFFKEEILNSKSHRNPLCLFSSFCSLLIWLGRALLEMLLIFLGLEVIFRLGPPLASTTFEEGISKLNEFAWSSHRSFHRWCDPNSRGSSSSWFPLEAFSTVSPGGRRRCRFLQIAFRSVCKTFTVCKECTEIDKKNPMCSHVTFTQNSSWSPSHSACCQWNGSWRTWPDRCSSRPGSCTFLACESQTSAWKIKK